MVRACFPMFSSFPQGKHCFQCQVLFSRCKLCLHYTAGNFNENPSMRAPAKLLRARTCKRELIDPHLIFASNSSKGQTLRALSHWMRPFDTPSCVARRPLCHKVNLLRYEARRVRTPGVRTGHGKPGKSWNFTIMFHFPGLESPEI